MTEAVRAAFARQAGWCEALGSPFTARLCSVLGRQLRPEGAIGRRVLGWAGNPDALHDSVPLRLCGGLHGLVRTGRLPDLAKLYSPNPLPDEDMLWAEVEVVLRTAEAELLPWLDKPPQTNEVARSGVLAPGLATVAAEFGLPLSLLELGASAGLNLLVDRFRCEAGARVYGDPSSPVRLAPAWDGADPPDAALRIADRRGVDIHPVDISDPGERARLLAYVWPDQAERLARLEAALRLGAGNPPPVDSGDAADWLGGRLERAVPGIVRVVYHSIAFQYFPPETQDTVEAVMAEAGAAATPNSPLAWLAYELGPEGGLPTLRLRTWPDRRDRILARADPHGRKVTWLA